jgi:hypothetical protein
MLNRVHSQNSHISRIWLLERTVILDARIKFIIGGKSSLSLLSMERMSASELMTATHKHLVVSRDDLQGPQPMLTKFLWSTLL